MVDLLVALERCSVGDALRRLAEFASIDRYELSPAELDARTEAHRRRLARERKAARAARRKAEAAAARCWEGLPRRSRAGETYLHARGVLAARGHVRFAPGWIVVALHDAGGAAVNMVSRRIGPGEPRVLGRRGCGAAGTLVGSLAAIDATTGPVVITEGVVDTLTAVVVWPGQLVLGAHGAGQMPAIANAVAPLLAARERKLLLVPDQDETGLRARDGSIDGAVEAGLPRESVEVLDVGHHKDFNDHFRAERR